MIGGLVGIAIKPDKRSGMELQNSGLITIEHGLVGDYRGHLSIERQVMVLSEEQWADACADVFVKVPWQAHQANILVRGIMFGPEDLNKMIYIGKDVVLGITGETAAHRRISHPETRLRSAAKTEWRGGVNCQVIQNGRIKLGDTVCLR